MEFNKREEYSTERKGYFYQISHNEFVHRSHFPSFVTWMKGNTRTEKFEHNYIFGVVDNSFFFEKDKIIKKAELINDRILFTELVTIENGIKVLLTFDCLYYFIERDNNANVSFAISINEDYRSKRGIKFNISIDELKKYDQIHVHDNFLFGITRNGNSSSIRRYQSDSEEYFEKKELPDVYPRFVIFSNWIFSLNREGGLISVNMNDLSYEIIKTNLGKESYLVGIDENGMVNVQTRWYNTPVHLFTVQLPEKYINQANMPKLIDTNEKRIEELERKVETEQKEKEELLMNKNLLENKLEIEEQNRNELERRLEDKVRKEEELLMNKEELERRIAVVEEEMKTLQAKYNKLLHRVRY